MKKPQDVVKYLSYQKGFPGGSDSEESTSNAGDWDSVPESGRFPWGREWLPTPIFLPGEFYGQRSLADYGLWSHKEMDMTE